jgi:hypothetical protein
MPESGAVIIMGVNFFRRALRRRKIPAESYRRPRCEKNELRMYAPAMWPGFHPRLDNRAPVLFNYEFVRLFSLRPVRHDACLDAALDLDLHAGLYALVLIVGKLIGFDVCFDFHSFFSFCFWFRGDATIASQLHRRKRVRGINHGGKIKFGFEAQGMWNSCKASKQKF